MDYIIYDKTNMPDAGILKETAAFLYEALGEFGDPEEDILRSLNYALEKTPSFGGFFIRAEENGELLGCVSVNCTGMKGYIPENNVTYLAVKESTRGQGTGKTLLKMAVNRAEGNLSLHVEPHNPAIKLYEKIGFVHKYNEMRLWKEAAPEEKWKL